MAEAHLYGAGAHACFEEEGAVGVADVVHANWFDAGELGDVAQAFARQAERVMVACGCLEHVFILRVLGVPIAQDPGGFGIDGDGADAGGGLGGANDGAAGGVCGEGLFYVDGRNGEVYVMPLQGEDLCFAHAGIGEGAEEGIICRVSGLFGCFKEGVEFVTGPKVAGLGDGFALLSGDFDGCPGLRIDAFCIVVEGTPFAVFGLPFCEDAAAEGRGDACELEVAKGGEDVKAKDFFGLIAGGWLDGGAVGDEPIVVEVAEGAVAGTGSGTGAVYLYLDAFPIGPGTGFFLGAEAGFLAVDLLAGGGVYPNINNSPVTGAAFGAVFLDAGHKNPPSCKCKKGSSPSTEWYRRLIHLLAFILE